MLAICESRGCMHGHITCTRYRKYPREKHHLLHCLRQQILFFVSFNQNNWTQIKLYTLTFGIMCSFEPGNAGEKGNNKKLISEWKIPSTLLCSYKLSTFHRCTYTRTDRLNEPFNHVHTFHINGSLLNIFWYEIVPAMWSSMYNWNNCYCRARHFVPSSATMCSFLVVAATTDVHSIPTNHLMKRHAILWGRRIRRKNATNVPHYALYVLWLGV